MKNFVKFTGFIALTAIITFAFTTCEDLLGNGGGGGGNGGGSDSPATYTGTANGTTYSLKITKAVNPGTNPGGNNPGGGSSSLNGTWIETGTPSPEKMVLNNGSFTISDDNVEVIKGTYTTSGSTITMTPTQIKGIVFGEDLESMMGFSPTQWYTRSQYKSAIVSYWKDNGMSPSAAEKEFEETKDISGIYDPQTGTYTLSSTTLTLTIVGEPWTYTRQGAANSVSYTDSARAAYTPAAGDNYELKVGTKTSTGKVQAFTGNNFTLQPSFSGAETFTATVGNNGLTDVSGLITFDNGTDEDGPGPVTPGTPGGSGGSIVGEWYDQSLSVLMYEFTADGKLFVMGGSDASYTYSVSGNTITVNNAIWEFAGIPPQTARFSISSNGNTLTLSNLSNQFPGPAGTFSKKASTSSVPAALVGQWYSWDGYEEDDPFVNFEITSTYTFRALGVTGLTILKHSTLGATSGTIYIASSQGAYDQFGEVIITFSYSISSGIMTVRNSTAESPYNLYAPDNGEYAKKR